MKYIIISKVKYAIVSCLAVLFFLSLTKNSLAAADPDASAETQRVLDYLISLPSLESDKVLSGQMIDYLNRPNLETFPNIYAIANEYPALMSGNYRNFGGESDDFTETNPLLIDHWNRGGLVEVAFFHLNPITNTWANTPVVDLQRVMTPGTLENTNFKAELDVVAVGLSELRDNGLVVLYRPLHEMNCPGAFWWSDRDFEDYKNLWKYEFNYLTQTKGLHNLLWVFSPHANFSNELNYYPGNSYVDIVGMDYYAEEDFPLLPGYTNLVALGKPFALTELGQCIYQAVPGGDPNCAGKDARKIIQGIKQNFPATVYWSNWSGYFSLDYQLHVNGLLNDSWVVNRGEISTFITFAIPTNLSAIAVSSAQVDLSWDAPVNDSVVVGYKVYRTGVLVATLGLQMTYSDTGLSPNSTYNYKVSTYDADGNESNKTTLVQATTQATDGIPPSAPQGLSVQ